MIADIRVVLWKEMRELFRQRSTLVSASILLTMFGVLFPARDGVRHLTSEGTIASMAVLPFAVIVAFIADAFAGERERHTLESLLATRLPDRAILLGKIGAAVLWGWSLAIVESLLALAVVNATSHAPFAFYAPRIWLAGLAFSLLVAILMSSLGVLVSLRAATVKQAQQILSIAVVVVIGVTLGGASLLPASVQVSLLHAIVAAGEDTLLLVGGVLLALVDAALLLACLARFQRARLILD